MASKAKLPVAPSSQALLDKKDISEDIVEVEEWGYSVKIRGLTRGEARKIGEADMSAEESEMFALQCAMVEPGISEDEARRLVSEKSYSATEKILGRIIELSGMVAGFR